MLIRNNRNVWIYAAAFVAGLLLACMCGRKHSSVASCSYAQDSLPYLSQLVMEHRSIDAYDELKWYYTYSGHCSDKEYLLYSLKMAEGGNAGFAISDIIYVLTSLGRIGEQGFDQRTKRALSHFVERNIEEKRYDIDEWLARAYVIESQMREIDSAYVDSLLDYYREKRNLYK